MLQVAWEIIAEMPPVVIMIESARESTVVMISTERGVGSV
jgi:hypothetical protein